MEQLHPATELRLLQSVFRLNTDIARIFDSFHTAQYQYIPALATASGDQLALSLNTPPSFMTQSLCWSLRCQLWSNPAAALHAVDPAASTAHARVLWCCRWKAPRWCLLPDSPITWR